MGREEPAFICFLESELCPSTRSRSTGSGRRTISSTRHTTGITTGSSMLVITVRASATPAYLGSESCVDPEEAFVASLSSCHMLTFLAIACKKRFTVDGYRDQAVGILGKDQAGRLAMTRVTLRPQVRFGGEKTPTPEELAQMHDQAHHACFIANSVKTEVVVEPQ